MLSCLLSTRRRKDCSDLSQNNMSRKDATANFSCRPYELTLQSIENNTGQMFIYIPYYNVIILDIQVISVTEQAYINQTISTHELKIRTITIMISLPDKQIYNICDILETRKVIRHYFAHGYSPMTVEDFHVIKKFYSSAGL